MIPVIFALLFLGTTIYAIVLDRAKRRHWEPDWIWLEVAIGSALCLAAATAATYAAIGATGLVIAGLFWLAFVVGGLPIVIWQMNRMNGRYRDAAAEARRLLERRERREPYADATIALAEPCRSEPHDGQGDR